MSCSRSGPYSNTITLFNYLDGLYPLHAAIYRKDEARVRNFISIQQSPIPLNSPLNIPLEGFLPEIRQALESYQFLSPFEVTILGDSPKIFEVLLNCGLVNIEAPSHCLHGQTPLQFSINQKTTTFCAVSIILASQRRHAANLNHHVAYLNCTDPSGYRASHYAARKGFCSVLSILAEHGADLNARNNHGYTPVQEAVRCQNYSTAIHLLSLPGVHLETDTQNDDLSFSIIQDALFKDNSLLLNAILNNNSEITDTVCLNQEELVRRPLIQIAALNDSINCLVALHQRGHVLDPFLQAFITANPEVFPKINNYFFPQAPSN